jgi:DNA mismatch endonuclease, patch repair protein
MQGNRSRDTRPEVAIRSAVHRRGLRFRKHIAPFPGLRCTADLVFPRERIAVFVDGCFWHGCAQHGKRPSTNSAYWTAKISRNAERDLHNTEALRAAGWTVLRLWEHEQPAAAAARIAREVERARGRSGAATRRTP